MLLNFSDRTRTSVFSERKSDVLRQRREHGDPSINNKKQAEKTIQITKKFPKIKKKKEISLIEKIAKKSVIYNRR